MCCNPLSHLITPAGCGMDHGAESEQSQMHTESALEILRKRYARGEISREQFEEMKKALA